MTSFFAASSDTTSFSAPSPLHVSPNLGEISTPRGTSPRRRSSQRCTYRVDSDGNVQGADCRCAWCVDSDEMWGAE